MSAPYLPGDAEPAPGPSAEECPLCHQPCGPLTLLTSMTRYYRCDRCGHSWQVTRVDDQPGDCAGGA